MNETRITVHGNVVNEPVAREGRNGSVFTTFRVATTPFKRTADGKFADGDTSFYNVIAFNALAGNVAAALKKGQPVIIEGTLAIRQWSGSDGQSGTSAEIDADHVGHDLSWGRASFERVSRAAALGYERTGDPEVRESLQAMNAAATETDRPAHVDADGVVDDDYDDSAPNSVTTLGDPETDPYVLQDPAA